jgi:hypothetical protein
MLNRQYFVLKLVGCGANGLRPLLAHSGTKSEGGKNAHVIEVIHILEGEITVDQLTDALKARFPYVGRRS